MLRRNVTCRAGRVQPRGISCTEPFHDTSLPKMLDGWRMALQMEYLEGRAATPHPRPARAFRHGLAWPTRA
jgi:hypothetical protein